MLKSKKKRKKRKFIFGLVMGLVFVFGLSPFQQIKADNNYTGALTNSPEYQAKLKALASNSTDPLINPKNSIIEGSLNKFVDASVTILGWSMKLLDYSIDQERFNEALFGDEGMRGINEGWKVLRDFLNMFFILMLLLVAFGTILRVQKFSDRKIIFSIIAAAVLINFSKTIALVIIDVSQLAMTFFSSMIHSNNQEFTAAIFEEIGMEKAFQGDVSDIFVSALLSIIFAIIMAFSIGVIAVALLVRLVAFYVLIILSPLAMFGIALPGTALTGMKNDWFTKMTKWAFFGPIMLFFLWLAFVVLNAITGNMGWENYVAGVQKNGKLIGLLVPFLAAIYLLIYGYDMSMKSSIGMANKILTWGNKKGVEWGRKLAKGSVAVGTLGLAPYAATRASGLTRGFRDKDRKFYNPLGWAKTKEGKEKIDKEIREEWEAKGRGESKKYRRKKAYQQLKEWKDEGAPDDDELRAMIKEGNTAASIKLAELGKIDSVEDVEGMIKTLGKGKKGDKSLENSLKKAIKETDTNEFNSFEAKQFGEKMKNNDFGDLLKDKRIKNAIREEGIEKGKEKEFILNEFASKNGKYDETVFTNNLLKQTTKTMGLKEINKQKKDTRRFFRKDNMENIKNIYNSAPREVVIKSMDELSANDFVFFRKHGIISNETQNTTESQDTNEAQNAGESQNRRKFKAPNL